MSYVGYISMWSLFKIGLSEIGLQTPVLCFLANRAILIYFKIGYRTGVLIVQRCTIIDIYCTIAIL